MQEARIPNPIITTQSNASHLDQLQPRITQSLSTARLRQAASHALTRSSHNRAVTRVLTSISQTGLQPRPNASVNPSIHLQFRSKAVCSLICQHCESNLCERGMRAILLGNTTMELFSTDRPPFGVGLVDKDYCTKNCSCRIRDSACLGCGNVVGYHVIRPCSSCLEACNNGHFWMFLNGTCRPIDRLDKSGILQLTKGSKILRWSAISEDQGEPIDEFKTVFQQGCR